MKRSLIVLISTAIALVFGACDQHSWDKGTEAQPATKEVFKPHGGHGGHGDDHEKDHGTKGEEHGDKKKDH